MRALPFILFLALTLTLAVMLLHKTEPTLPGAASAETMPAITVTTLDGNKPWQADALKGRVTLINFFASWCTPCAAEMPELAAVKKQFPSVHIAGIAWNDKPAILKQWLKKNGNPYQSLWFDKDGSATIALGIRGIPETFVVDSHGVVRYRLAGPLTEELRTGEFGALLTALTTEAADAR